MTAVAAMLFAQLAVAAHGCAAIAGASPAHEAMAVSPGDSPCHEAAAPARTPENLCVQHCADQQSADNHPATPVAPALMPVCPVAAADPSCLSPGSTQRYSHALLARVTAPPLAVQHCRFLT